MATPVKSSAAPAWAGRLPQPRPAASERTDNARWASRKKSDLPGYIYGDRLQSAARVFVRDHSSSGALLQLREAKGPTVDDVPDQFVLVLKTSREHSEVSCTVVRRYGDCIGVRYSGMFRAVATPAKRR